MENDLMYKLSNGCYMRIYMVESDPDCEYGFEYYDDSKALVDGGEFNTTSESPEPEEVLTEAMWWVDLDPTTISTELISEDAGYFYLEDNGFTGW